jgi:hypothetical protein
MSGTVELISDNQIRPSLIMVSSVAQISSVRPENGGVFPGESPFMATDPITAPIFNAKRRLRSYKGIPHQHFNLFIKKCE